MRLLAAPRIYGFLNGMFSTTSFIGTSVTEEGKVLCSVVCRDQAEMRMALGMDGKSMSRHAIYQKEYPKGYIVEYVPWAETSTHTGLQRAIAAHRKAIKVPYGEGAADDPMMLPNEEDRGLGVSHRGTRDDAVGT